jgi:hypothetical protein
MVPVGETDGKALVCRRTWADLYRDSLYIASYGTIPVVGTIAYSTGTTFVLEMSSSLELGEPIWVVLSCQTDRATLHSLRLRDPVTLVPSFNDVLLIVNFNSFDESSPAVLDEYLALYGQAFPNIMVVSSTNPSNASLLAPEGPVHYVPNIRRGWNMYLAMEYGMRSRTRPYRGYLLSNNDVAMRFWKWGSRDWNRISIQPVNPKRQFFGCHIDYRTPSNDSRWNTWHWHHELSKHLLQNLIEQTNGTDRDNLFSPCGSNILYNTESDFFYVPDRLREKYLSVLDMVPIDSSSILFEALTPMILSITEPSTEWASLNALYCWDGCRAMTCPLHFIGDHSIDIAHPWKLLHDDTKNIQHPFSEVLGRRVWIEQSDKGE